MKSEIFVRILIVSSFVHIPMRYQKILQLGFAIIGMHLFSQFIMCKRTTFTKKEDFYLLEFKNETENNGLMNDNMFLLTNNFFSH